MQARLGFPLTDCSPTAIMCDADPLLCRCLQVYRSQVVDCIAVTGAESVREVGEATGAGRGCLACHCRIKELLAVRTRSTVAVGA